MLANGEMPVDRSDCLVVSPIDRVVLQQVGDILGRAEIVCGDHIQASCVHDNLECGATAPPESVNGDPDHSRVLSVECERKVWSRDRVTCCGPARWLHARLHNLC